MAEKVDSLLNPMIIEAYKTLLKNWPTFHRTYRYLKKSQRMSKEEISAYQLKRLKELVSHAYENVPYYTQLFDKIGLKPSDVQSFEDFKKIPYLTKQLVQENINLLKAKNYPSDAFQYVSTGGSTGIPMGFYLEEGVSNAKERAFIKTMWDRVGYNFRDKCVYLRGTVIKDNGQGKFWDYAMLNRWLILSSYHMKDEHLPSYIEKIREFKPKFFQAYPSSITILASYMREHNIPHFPTVKAILCGSENLYPFQRALIEEVFQCRVYSWYGHSEQAVLGGECEYCSNYHFFPEYGYVELINEFGSEVTAEGAIGEIVATGFNNPIFPFLRYYTEDVGVFTKEKCKCGRNYPLIKRVEGRLQELIITGDDRLISMVALNMHSDIFNNVKQFQFFQEKKGEVVLNVVKKENYTEKESDIILKELYRKLGDNVNIVINFVDDIPRTKSGKHRFLIQKLPLKFGD